MSTSTPKPPFERKPVYGYVGLLMAAVIALTAGLTYALSAPTNTTAPTPKIATPLCQKDPAKQIEALPPGGTFTGVGTYCTNGILLTKPVTVIGGNYIDSNVKPPHKVKGKSGAGLAPIFEVKDTPGPVTIEGTSVTGSDTAVPGTYKAPLVGQAGYDIRSADNVTLTDNQSLDTWGDGLTVFIDAGGSVPTGISVTDLLVTNPGRDGVSPAAVTDSTFTGITVAGVVHDSAFDFEADIPGFAGDSGDTFANIVAKGGINIIEKVGVLSWSNTTTPKFYMSAAGAQVSYQGSFVCNRRAPSPCVWVKNGTLTLVEPTAQSYLPGSSKISEIPYLAMVPGVIVGP